MEHPLRPFFRPRSVVVAGASNNVGTMGTIQLLNLMSDGFPGPIYCIHPTEETVFGLPTFRRAADLPEAPDLAVVIIPSRHVPALVDDLGARGVKAGIVISGGFRESGDDEGAARERALLETARRRGMRLIGPNCIGVINPHAKFNTTVHPYGQPPGQVGLASQSGTYVTQVLPYLARRGWGFSKAVSMGNSADLNLIDAIAYLGDDPETSAIALYVEGVRDGRAFFDAARAASAKKPLIALYVGGSEAGARASASHTGAMAGSDLVHAGAFAQAGIVRAPDVEGLYGMAHALAHQPPMRGPRVGIVTNSGGPAASISDAVARQGLALPVFSDGLQAKLKALVPMTASVRNPVDVTFSLDLEAFLIKIVDAVLSSGEVDALVVHGVIGSTYLDVMKDVIGSKLALEKEPFVVAFNEVLDRMLDLVERRRLPVVSSAFWGIEDSSIRRLHTRGVSCYLNPERAVQALRGLWDRGRFEKRRQQAVTS